MLTVEELKQKIYDEMIESARKSTCVKIGDIEINKVATSNEINPYWKGREIAFSEVLGWIENLGDNIALPYLLCTSSKFACVIWRDKDGKVHKTYTMPTEEAKGVLKEKERLQND